MKKSLFALAVLSAFAGAASAQSSVTLFGILDVAAMSVKNGSAGSIKSLGQDGVNSSRLGFRGIEDLGGGLRAQFWVEGAFGPDTGCGGAGTLGNPPAASCAGQTWQRKTHVGLIGNFGEIRLGRDYTPTFNNIAAFDPWGYNGVGHIGQVRSALGSGATTQVRANNTIAYFLPALGGLYGQLQVAAGEASTGNKNIAGRIGYAAGPINVGAAYAVTKKTGTMVDDYTTANIGASFNLGFMTIMGSYEQNEYSREEQQSGLVGVLVPIGPGTLRASYVMTKGDTASAVLTNQYKAKMMGVGYVYDLSKRTALYAQYAQINNDGNATNGALASVYGANGGPTAGFRRGETSSGYQFGIRHSF